MPGPSGRRTRNAHGQLSRECEILTDLRLFFCLGIFTRPTRHPRHAARASDHKSKPVRPLAFDETANLPVAPAVRKGDSFPPGVVAPGSVPMRLSKKTEYALRALFAIARAADGRVTTSWRIEELSRQENIPIKFLEQILLSLRNAGLLASKRGVGGGYRMARRPDEISVGEVIRALDGPFTPLPCASATARRERCSCPDERTMSAADPDDPGAVADGNSARWAYLGGMS